MIFQGNLRFTPVQPNTVGDGGPTEKIILHKRLDRKIYLSNNYHLQFFLQILLECIVQGKNQTTNCWCCFWFMCFLCSQHVTEMFKRENFSGHNLQTAARPPKASGGDSSLCILFSFLGTTSWKQLHHKKDEHDTKCFLQRREDCN